MVFQLFAPKLKIFPKKYKKLAPLPLTTSMQSASGTLATVFPISLKMRFFSKKINFASISVYGRKNDAKMNSFNV